MAHILPKSGLEKILICSSCSDLLTTPTTICENGHCFCQDCNSPKCPKPNCSKPPHSNHLLDQIISICEVPCTNQEVGCPKIIRYDHLLGHTTKECDFRNIRCVLGESGKICNELIFRDVYVDHISKCRYKNYTKDFKLGTEIDKYVDIPNYLGKPFFIQSVFRHEALHFIESIYHDKATREFFICYHFVGKNSQAKRYKYTIKLYQDSFKALTLTCPCLPMTNNGKDIRNDIRCVTVDPAKFTNVISNRINYSFKIE